MSAAKDSIGLFDAKTHLSALLERVERGEEITITRRGMPVARLVPARRAVRSPAETARRIKELRKGTRLGATTIRELIEEGRRR